MSAPLEGTVDVDGPRCYRHDVPSLHGLTPGGPGLPAHTWDGPPRGGACLRCHGPMHTGDRYLCDEGGIVHVACPPPIELK